MSCDEALEGATESEVQLATVANDATPSGVVVHDRPGLGKPARHTARRHCTSVHRLPTN